MPSGRGRSRRQRPFEELGKRVQGILPGIALSGHLLVQRAQRQNVTAAGGPILDKADDRAEVRELDVGQVTANLPVGVRAEFQMAVQSQDELAVKCRLGPVLVGERG